MNKYFVIGDIHGDIKNLEILLGVSEIENRKIIFLGDYVNRGKESKKVIQKLIDLKNKNQEIVFLAGNHDIAFIDYLDNNNFVEFASAGGLPTLKSYLDTPNGDVHKQLIKVFPETHMHFLRSLTYYFEDEKYFISHAGINPKKPNSRALKDLIGNNSSLWALKNKEIITKKIICGHYLQKTKEPFVSKNLICLDTGCGTINGPLSGIYLPEEKIIMSK